MKSHLGENPIIRFDPSSVFITLLSPGLRQGGSKLAWSIEKGSVSRVLGLNRSRTCE
jgi:hypothetical protein